MNTLKSIIAANIASLRTANNMTQLALAEKLCYSDKAVSKWERGESVPDISVLKQIADLFNVTVDYIITDHRGDQTPPPCAKKVSKGVDRLLITLISLTGAWFVGLLTFVLIWILSGNIEPVIFICCMPVSALLILIFNSIWGKRGKRRIINYFSITLFIWSVLLILYVFVNVWQLFLLGIPGQIVLSFAIFIRARRSALRNIENNTK